MAINASHCLHVRPDFKPVAGRRWRLHSLVVATVICILSGAASSAQEAPDTRLDEKTDNTDAGSAKAVLPGFKLTQPKTYRMKVSIRVDAIQSAVRNVIAHGPVPIDWPEQKVKLISESKPRGSTTKLHEVKGLAGMLFFQVPAIPQGGSAVLERVYEITRYRSQFQVDPTQLRQPKKKNRKLRNQLGKAPGVETNDKRIVTLAKSLAKANANSWSQVRVYFDWVRANVKYELGDFRGASLTLKQKTGDCEDMSALFVALCRVSDIPARTVWIEGHAYPEFYLEDEQGQGYWIPAQVSGLDWFGEMTEHRPILQKGNRFHDPLRRRYWRFVPQGARAIGGPTRVTFTRTLLTDKGERKFRQGD